MLNCKKKKKNTVEFLFNLADLTWYQQKRKEKKKRRLQGNLQWQSGKIPFSESTAAASVSHLCTEQVPEMLKVHNYHMRMNIVCLDAY